MANLSKVYSPLLAKLAAEAARGRALASRTRSEGFKRSAHRAYHAGKEPVGKILAHEGTSLGTHGASALADNHLPELPIPFTSYSVKPSTALGGALVLLMAFTKGKNRTYARQAFQGVLHRKLSVAIDSQKATISGVLAGITADDSGDADAGAEPDL